MGRESARPWDDLDEIFTMPPFFLCRYGICCPPPLVLKDIAPEIHPWRDGCYLACYTTAVASRTARLKKELDGG